MHLEYSHCKTIKVQCQKIFNCWVRVWKIVSVQYHVGLQLLQLFLRHALMVQYQLVGSCVFACVKLCVYGQWMYLEYCRSCQRVAWAIKEGTSPNCLPLKLLLQSKQRTVPNKLQLLGTTPHSLYFLHLALQNTYGRRMVHYQLVCSHCLYNCAVNLWAVNALRIWSQLT